MTDRELLEAAARAAGIKALLDPHGRLRDCTAGSPFMDIFAAPLWNPLTDDGDALRLAVKLNLRLVFHPVLNQALVRPYHSDSMETESRENGEAHADPYAATRRAIVRAAAAMATS